MSEEAAEPKKRKSRPKYTQFTLEHLRANGKVPAIVERLIPSRPFMQRKDMFGLFDIVYFDPETGETGYVQSTGDAGRSEHKRKMLATADEPPYILRLILKKGNAHADLYTWKKNDHGRWEVRVERVVRKESLLDVQELAFEDVGVPSMAASRAVARERQRS